MYKVVFKTIIDILHSMMNLIYLQTIFFSVGKPEKTWGNKKPTTTEREGNKRGPRTRKRIKKRDK